MIRSKVLFRPTTFIALAVGAVLALLAVNTLFTQPTHGADAKDFNPGHIIDDVVFYNNGSMSASQIQSFLNSKNPNCDTNGTGAATDWGRPDITRATLASYIRNGTHGYTKNTSFHAPPYTCTKDYKQNTPQMEAASGLCEGISAKTNRSAANIIKDISDACGINPQVLLVLLQKEQSLITDIWPLDRQFQKATGFDCPDTAPCDPAFAGFFYQLYYAARQFKIYKAYPNNYNYVAGRTNRIYWHPDLSRCGSSNVYIENQATAGLYIYTPYRPNSAALNNLYGTGDSCSSYGNRNFWRLFTDWFGSTRFTTRGGIGLKYEQLGAASSPLGMPTSNEACRLVQDGCRQTFEHGVIYWTRATDAQALWGGILEHWKSISAERSYLGYPTSGEIKITNGVYQQFQNGRIYWKSGIGAWNVHGGIGERYLQIDGHASTLGYPTSKETCGLANGGCSQVFESGKIFWSSSSKAWEISGLINERWQQTQAENGFLGYPTGPQVVIDNGVYQQFQNGRIYFAENDDEAYSTHGGIGSRYTALGGHASELGFPITNESCQSSGRCQQKFENGTIIWGSGAGAWVVEPSIIERWELTGAENGYLGYPTKNAVNITNGLYQQFQNGRIYWSDQTNAWSIHGGIGARYLSMGGHMSILGLPIGSETKQGDSVYQQFQNGRIYWKNGATWIE